MTRTAIPLLVATLLSLSASGQEPPSASAADESIVQEVEQGIEQAKEKDEPPFAPEEPTIDPVGAPLPMTTGLAPPDWRPPTADESQKDWIRLKTGEWLKGNIDNIQDGTLYFDSAELDELEIDWPVIAELRSSSVNSYRFEGRVVVTGTAGMVDGVMRIEAKDGIHEFEQAKLVGFIEGDLSEWNFWSGDLSFSVAALSGNSNQADLQGRFNIKRETPLTRTFARYTGVYASNKGTKDPTKAVPGETANNHRVDSSFDVYLTRRLFFSVPFIRFLNDRFSNIDVRLTPGAGVGYEVIVRPQVSWEVSGGFAYQYTKFNSVTPTPADPNPSQSANDAALVIGSVLETDPWSYLEWDSGFTATLTVTDFDKTNLHFQTILSLDIWGPLDLDLGFFWDYIVKPQQIAVDNPGSPLAPPSGTFQPDSNDIRLTAGISYDW